MMKQIKQISIALMVVFFLAGSAMALPIFQGDTAADFGTGATGLPVTLTGNGDLAGYYIWTNDAEHKSWSIRWTGDGLGYEWAGSILYSNCNGLQTVNEVLWENPSDGTPPTIVEGGYYVPGFGMTVESIYFGFDNGNTAYAGPHWDGFDFTLTGSTDPQDFLTFDLQSTLFNSVDTSIGIYIGQALTPVLDMVDSEQFFVSTQNPWDISTHRIFQDEAPIPEPGTLLLLGGGLLGLVAYRRKRK